MPLNGSAVMDAEHDRHFGPMHYADAWAGLSDDVIGRMVERRQCCCLCLSNEIDAGVKL